MSAQTVSAQAPLFNWTGFYIGGNIGWAKQEVGGIYLDPPPDKHIVHFDTLIGGAHAGFQVQSGNWIAGLETAYSGFSKSSGESFSVSSDCINLSAVANRTCKNQMKGFFTAGVRLGFASGSWMIFTSGGYASARLNTETLMTSTGTSFGTSSFERHNGWYAGAGADFMFSPNWIGGIEYQYVDLEEKTHVAGGIPRSIGATSHIARARISYLFNAPQGR